MTPTIVQNSVASIVVYLELSATGLPATGLTSADLTAALKKEGGAFSAFTLTGSNFTELSGGFYEIDFAAANTDVLGSLYLSIAGATIKTALVVARIVTTAETSAVISSTFTPTISNVFGYVYDSAGHPKANASISARLLSSPTMIHPVDQGIVLSADLITTATDEYGFFTLGLIVGTQVEVIIPAAGYRRTIRVPGTNTNLFDIP
ncbi:hypothetical protein HC928_00355 [bacterium]|nr:hypothetical protein [bacterium]